MPFGIVTVSVVPWPGTLVTSQHAAMQPHEIVHERQSDAGAFVRSRARALDAVEPLEDPRHLVGARCRRRCRAPTSDTLVAEIRQADLDAALKRELQRVREQVEDDLLPHRAIDRDRLRHRIAPDVEGEPRALECRAERAGEVGREPRQIRRLERRSHPAGFIVEKSSSVFTSLSRRSSLR